MKLRQLTEADVEFSILAEQDDLQIVGNAMASGDDKVDKEAEAHIFMELAQGNVWAWAYVTVMAKWNNVRGVASLGGCSYKSEEDFKQPGGYYDDMKQEALDDLNKGLQEMADNIEPLIEPVQETNG